MTPPPCDHPDPTDPSDMTHRQMILATVGSVILFLLLWVLFDIYSPVMDAVIERYK